MTTHPGSTMTIYDIPNVVSTAFPLAVTPHNILAGFRAAGISPFNRDIFQDSDFLGAYVTDRPEEDQQETQVFQASEINVQPATNCLDGNDTPRPSTSGLCGKKAPTPEELRPLPKAGPRKGSGMNRRKRSSAILTDTPVKKALEKISKEKCTRQKEPYFQKQRRSNQRNQNVFMVTRKVQMKRTVSVWYAWNLFPKANHKKCGYSV
ncbi:uncharacterized protein LOC123508968 [Portunus trituberculatus]|nr:uncharacterized protein LOC123508968 [Portunus trituberculatus]